MSRQIEMESEVLPTAPKDLADRLGYDAAMLRELMAALDDDAAAASEWLQNLLRGHHPLALK